MTQKITYPYMVVSDVHFHAFDFGSYTRADGVNSRLAETIAAFKEAAYSLRASGGYHIVITGDLFHTRGEIKPSIYNPVYDMFRELSLAGFVVHAIPGNHDLETDETTEEGNCFKSFASIENFNIYYTSTRVEANGETFLFIPWTEAPKVPLIRTIKASRKSGSIRPLTIFCHIGLSGVVTGIGNAIDPAEFAEIEGLKYVFSGHFHNHKCFKFPNAEGESRIYSVGALTHQSFKDVDSLAGYVIVQDPKTVVHEETSAPKFVDYVEADWMDFKADKFVGNYVRMNASFDANREEIIAIRAVLESIGSAKVINKMTADDSDRTGRVVDPTRYVYGLKSKTIALSEQFKDYIRHRYNKEMAASMIEVFEKDGVDER